MSTTYTQIGLPFATADALIAALRPHADGHPGGFHAAALARLEEATENCRWLNVDRVIVHAQPKNLHRLARTCERMGLPGAVELRAEVDTLQPAG